MVAEDGDVSVWECWKSFARRESCIITLFTNLQQIQLVQMQNDNSQKLWESDPPQLPSETLPLDNHEEQLKSDVTAE